MKTIMAPESPEKTSQVAFSQILLVQTLAQQGAGKVNTTPTTKEITIIRDQLGLIGLRKVTLKGNLKPLDRTDWRLTARLGATIVQECVVTLAPVTTRIEELVERVWRIDIPEMSEAGSEEEMPENTNEELLGREIDLGQVLTEALGLALPPYPRAKDAEIGQTTFAQPGTAPMQDEETRPFAGLAALRDKMSGSSEGDDEGSE